MASAPSQQKSSGTNEPLDNGTQPSHHHENDAVSNVRRAFREYTTALVLVSRQAGTSSGVDASSGRRTSADENTTNTPLEEAAAQLVKRKQSLRSNATLLEGKLRGNVKESEALQCSLRSQPCVGGRKGLFSNTHH